VTNSYGITQEELGNVPSSTVVGKVFKGAQLVKAFNHLDAETLAKDPVVHGGKRVIFLSSDDDAAIKPVTKLVEMLGFAPVSLGPLAVSAQVVQAHGKTWAPLIFQNFVKFD
jgi:8-hydroxy-5-deazaflavin:NADPH oxidoreductase